MRDETGRPVHVGGRQLRVLLTLLALNAGRVVPAGSLAGELWPDNPSSSDLNAVSMPLAGRAARSRKPDSGHADTVTVRVRRASRNPMKPRIQCPLTWWIPGAFQRAGLVSLARVAEHDLVPGRHRGPPAARCLPALACRLLTRGLRLSLLT